jgi:hypothetical protein
MKTAPCCSCRLAVGRVGAPEEPARSVGEMTGVLDVRTWGVDYTELAGTSGEQNGLLGAERGSKTKIESIPGRVTADKRTRSVDKEQQ